MFYIFAVFFKNSSSEGAKFPGGEYVNILLDGSSIRVRKGLPLSAALYDVGIKFLGRSVKYFRPRGIIGLTSLDRSCLVKVNSFPNINPNKIYASEGVKIETSRSRGSFLGRIFSRFASVGFQHRLPFRIPFIWNIVKWFVKKMPNYFELDVGDSDFEADVLKINVDVAIVGGGLAGLSAAKILAENDVRVALFEEDDFLGGRAYYDLLLSGINGEPLKKIVLDLIRDVEGLGVDIYKNVSIGGFFEDGVFGFENLEPFGKKIFVIDAKAFIISTGIVDVPCIFDGNDLPGIITGDSALRLVNLYDVKLGEEIIVLGLNNYGARVAIQLARKGYSVKILGKRWEAREQLYLLDELDREGIEIFEGVKEIIAKGKYRVEKIIAKFNGSKRIFDVDTVVCASLRNPNYRLPAQAGVEILYFDGLGFTPIHDANLRTHVKGIVLAGGVTGSIHEKIHMVEGELSARSVLSILGRNSNLDENVREYKNVLKRFGLLEAKKKIFEVFSGNKINETSIGDVPTFYSSSPSNKQFICFCEDVTAKDLFKTVREIGFDKMELIKRYSGIATGFCQGKLCLINTVLLAAKILGKDPNKIGFVRQRPPIVPINIGLLKEVEKP